MENFNATETVYFDRQGDLDLRSMESHVGPHGSSVEAQPEKDKTIPLPEDDLGALSLLLHIAHRQFNMVPTHLEFTQLLAVAMLTDKYQATELVIPWLPGWLENLIELVGNDGYEEWLWIAWQFGMLRIFDQVSNQLVMGLKLNDDGFCVIASVKIFVEESFPPGILESILCARYVTIARLLDVMYAYVEKFSDLEANRLCRSSIKTSGYNAIMLGSLLLYLQELGLWPERKHPSGLSRSVRKLSGELDKLEILSYPMERNHLDGYHSSCNFGDELRNRLKEILMDMPIVVLDSHKRHLESQLSKCTSLEV